jgi:hypothetical protein
MIASTAAKIEQAKAEAQDAKRMRDQMRTAGIGSGPAERLHKRATERVGFLVKVKAALEAGYLLMPDMPGEVLAVRTSKDPAWPSKRFWGEYHGLTPTEPANHRLPPGEGWYANPNPDTQFRTVNDPVSGKFLRDEIRATMLRDPSGIDHKFLKPAIIDKMTGAMTRHIFDEIVCVGAKPTKSPTPTRADPDPIVLGRVVSGRQVAAFLIAWFVDLSEL